MAAYGKALSNAIEHEGIPVAEFCGVIETLRGRLFTVGKTIDDGARVGTVLSVLPSSTESVRVHLHNGDNTSHAGVNHRPLDGSYAIHGTYGQRGLCSAPQGDIKHTG